MTRALLVLNKKASRASGAEAALQRLREGGIELVPARADGPAQVAEEIGRQRDRVDLVVVAGGDGTVNCAIAPLVGNGPPLGLLPFGTANDLARTLGLPDDPAAAADVILSGRTRKIDVALANDRYFVNVASCGLSVRLARRMDERADRKRAFGAVAYVLTLVEVLRAMRPFRVRIRAEGEVIETRAIQVSVGNGRHYGGGLTVAEDAQVDDGRLDLYVVKGQSLHRLAMMAPSLRTGRIGQWEHVLTRSGPAFRLETTRPRRVNTDGEITTSTPTEFTVRRKALTVCVDEESGPGLGDAADAKR